MASNHQLGR